MRRGVRHHHHELLTAVARGEVGATHVADQRSRERREREVAGVMPVGVVEQLEVVDVEHQDRERGSEPFGERDLLSERVDEEAMVVQTGEIVDRRLTLHHREESIALERE